MALCECVALRAWLVRTWINLSALFCLVLLVIGLGVVLVDVEEHAWGLHLMLWALTALALLFAFYIVNAEQPSLTEKALAKTVQQTLQNNQKVIVQEHKAIVTQVAVVTDDKTHSQQCHIQFDMDNDVLL